MPHRQQKKSACGIKKEEKKLVNFPGLLPQAAEGAPKYISLIQTPCQYYFAGVLFLSEQQCVFGGRVTGV
jgi:hypothetical protein